MALIFSKITMSGGQHTVVFLVGGIPHTAEDLRGWIAFKAFRKENKNLELYVSVEARRYGDDQDFAATPEEVAYLYYRTQLQHFFLEERTELIGRFQFTVPAE